MSGDDWFRELPFSEEEDDDLVQFIIEQVARPVVLDRGDKPKSKDLDLTPYEDALRRLVGETRRVYRLALSDWLRRNEPDWQPQRRLRDNQEPDEPEPTYDYGEDTGAGLEDWDAWWRENWGKGRGNPGGSRTREGMPITPLEPIYFLVNKWWRRVLREPFRPDFRRGVEGWSVGEKMSTLNPAGRLFLLIAQDLNRYTYTICLNLHERLYRRLDTRIK